MAYTVVSQLKSHTVLNTSLTSSMLIFSMAFATSWYFCELSFYEMNELNEPCHCLLSSCWRHSSRPPSGSLEHPSLPHRKEDWPLTGEIIIRLCYETKRKLTSISSSVSIDSSMSLSSVSPPTSSPTRGTDLTARISLNLT